MRLKLSKEESQRRVERGKKTMAAGVAIMGIGCLTTIFVVIALILILIIF